jgi:hypothetical protein
MTREDQRLEEAKNRFSDDQIYPITKMYVFIEGAKWADAHPNPNTIKKIFEFALEKTNFLIADNLESIDWEVLIKKAMEESL